MSSSANLIVTVTLVDWPDDRACAEELSRQGAPYLLLVAGDAQAPKPMDRLADWIRIPADPCDVQARIVSLERRAASLSPPVLDDLGLLHRGRMWVNLTPIQTRLAQVFLARPGEVLSRRMLGAAGWIHGHPQARSLDARVHALRRRIAPLGLQIHTATSRGYILAISETPQQPEAR
jgi:hypothetical protein